MSEDRMVKCIYCKKPIHISKFGGSKKEGMFCNSYVCMVKLMEEESAEKTNKESK